MSQSGLFSGVICFICLYVLGFFFIIRNSSSQYDSHLQIRQFGIAFVLRFAASIALYEFGLVRVVGSPDAEVWKTSIIIRDIWLEEGIGILEFFPRWIEWITTDHKVNNGYRYLSVLFFYFTGLSSRLPLAVVGGFFGALTVILTYRIAAQNFSSQVAERAGWVTCLFPSLILWSSQTLKEPLVIFIEILVIYSCFMFLKRGLNIKYITVCSLGILALYNLRFYVSYACFATVILSILFLQLRAHRLALILSVVAASSFIVVGSNTLQKHVDVLESYDIQRFSIIRQDLSGGGLGSGSGVDLGYDTSTIIGSARQVTVGCLYFLLAPFPWSLGGASLRMLVTLPESVIWWVLFLGGVLSGMWYMLRKRLIDCLPFLIFLGLTVMMYSFAFANIGLAYRQRAQLLPYFFIIAMVGFEQYALRRKDAKASRFVPNASISEFTPGIRRW